MVRLSARVNSRSCRARVTIALAACRAAASSRVEHVSGALAQRAPVVVRLRRAGHPDGTAAPAGFVSRRHVGFADLTEARAMALAHHQRSVPGRAIAIATAARKPLSSPGRRSSNRERWNPTSSASWLGGSSSELHPGQRASRTSMTRQSSVRKRVLQVSHFRWGIRTAPVRCHRAPSRSATRRPAIRRW